MAAILQHRTEIDGLRAIAVGPVILFHAGLPELSGGFVGVDVFFVISGYLITALLIEDLERGRFSLGRFYERRARRILPALVVMLLACMPAAWLWLMPRQMADFSQSVVATATFASNILFWLKSGYFDTASELKPLLHTWSLAVEEQFYLFFPPLLWLIWRGGRRLAWLAIAALALASFAVSVLPWIDSNATFYLTPARVWELMAGSLCALALTRHAPLRHPLPGLAGLALIGAPMVIYSPDTAFNGWTVLPVIAGSALVILGAGPGTPTARLLSLRPLVWLGLISYSAYLWHQPLFAFARLASPDVIPLPAMLALAVAVLPLAWLTWAFVEQPARRTTALSRPALLSLSAAVLAVLAAVGLAGHLTGGAQDRFATPSLVANGEFVIPSRQSGYCFIVFDAEVDNPADATPGDCLLGTVAAPSRRYVLLGDSYAAQYEPFWDDVGKAQDIQITAMTTNWCFPSFGTGYTGPLNHPAYDQCLVNRAAARAALTAQDRLIISGNWAAVGTSGLLPEVFELIDDTVASGKEVIVMLSPVQLRASDIERAVYTDLAPRRDPIAEPDTLGVHAVLQERYGAVRGVRFITREAMFGPPGRAQVMTAEDYPYSLDGGHLSIYGARMAARNVLQDGGL